MDIAQARRKLREVSADIERAANQIRSSNPKLSREQATDRALTADPDLYTRWKVAHAAIRALGGF